LTPDEVQTLVDEATFDFAMGEAEVAAGKLRRAVAAAPDSSAGWHALAEVALSLRHMDEALSAAERAQALAPQDQLANATLSRIWMERGEKTKAEHFGAQARMQSWKEELKGQAEPPSGELR
jgi:cytochrome c-type biogenesis protein CcmH/NrfG